MPDIRLLLAAFLLCCSTVAHAQGVVSAADPRAAEAGREILRKGGSATDAAMAMMLALTVVEPQSSGIGGGGFLVHHDSKSGTASTIDGRETAPAAANAAWFLGADGKPRGFREVVPSGLSVGVPGNIALMAQAHAKWGKLGWAQLFKPAIRLARKGYVVTPRLAGALDIMKPFWPRFPDAQAIYWQEGRPKIAGEKVRNPALAAFLKTVARQGPSAFYAGEHPGAIAAAVNKHALTPAPLMARRDVEAYQAKERAAVCTTYRAYRLCGMGPPSSGATTVFQILGLVERFDMKALGKDSPVAWHVLAEAMRLGYADRERYLADADFVDVPVTGLLDKDYIAARSALIAADKTRGDYPPGTPPGAPARTRVAGADTPGTTHFVAVDRSGNIASMTSTVEGPFGSQIIVNGYFLNNELTDFTFAPVEQGEMVANRVEGGKRPLSSMAPTIVYGPDGKPVLAIGAAGGKTIIMQVAKALIAKLDWGLSAQDAIAAPGLYYNRSGIMVEADSPLAAMAPALRALGQSVEISSMSRLKANAAEWTAQGWRGAADPRSEGVSLSQ